MSHRKTHSQGCVPFSWEEKPGISKFNHQKSSSDIGQNSLKIMPENFETPININPPPPCTPQFPRKRYSLKGLWWHDDPFLAALKSCTKSVSSRRSGHEEYLRQKGNESKGKNCSTNSVFSCKHSCDVENDNLVKFSRLPPLPRERYNAKPFVTQLI
ncbi:hypothetical protein BUALT_Bualt04G0097900 [Buddleja alternifolia]|uniref:Uncharacterized protein n=1 Tax=Buddleja alternifolia TaxID=168488 RepID=A0AAV6XP27_9LAMI|nr:hypothetical protein BUALT_Bualt04G0097900 [Buddleja alternifolia]